MGKDFPIQHEPGNVSGTVVPPPTTPLPQRSLAKRAQRPDGSDHTAPAMTPPALPDSLRDLLRPVLTAPSPSPEPAQDEPAPKDAEPQGAQAPPSARARRERPRPTTEAPPSAPAKPERPRPTTDAPPSARAKPERPRPTRQVREGRHIVWLVAITVLLLITATGTTFALLRQGSSGSGLSQAPAGNGGVGRQLPVFSSAAAVRTQAASWVAHQVSRSALIGCDPVMCAALYKAGVPASDVQVLRPGAADPLGLTIIVASQALRSQFGARLASEYAPAVLATFGRGRQRVDVRVEAADGAAAYLAAERQDLAARKKAGAELLGIRQIMMPVTAQAQLAAGDVDPRLLVMLPVLAAEHPIRILGFYNQAPGASPGTPLSAVRLAGTDQLAGLPARSYQQWLLSFFGTQRAIYSPASVSTTSGGGQVVVTVRFTWPNPLGLLSQ